MVILCRRSYCGVSIRLLALIKINLADCIDDLMKTALETAEVITVGA